MACAAKGLDSEGPPSLLCRLYFEAWLRTSISLFGAYARLCFLSLCETQTHTHTHTHTSSSMLLSGRPLVSLALVPFLSLVSSHLQWHQGDFVFHLEVYMDGQILWHYIMGMWVNPPYPVLPTPPIERSLFSFGN